MGLFKGASYNKLRSLHPSFANLRKSTALRLLSAAGCYLASFLSSLLLFEFRLPALPRAPPWRVQGQAAHFSAEGEEAA